MFAPPSKRKEVCPADEMFRTMRENDFGPDEATDVQPVDELIDAAIKAAGGGK
jgi:hypothetical protein